MAPDGTWYPFDTKEEKEQGISRLNKKFGLQGEDPEPIQRSSKICFICKNTVSELAVGVYNLSESPLTIPIKEL